jgi:hypothetical protein
MTKGLYKLNVDTGTYCMNKHTVTTTGLKWRYGDRETQGEIGKVHTGIQAKKEGETGLTRR